MDVAAQRHNTRIPYICCGTPARTQTAEGFGIDLRKEAQLHQKIDDLRGITVNVRKHDRQLSIIEQSFQCAFIGSDGKIRRQLQKQHIRSFHAEFFQMFHIVQATAQMCLRSDQQTRRFFGNFLP